MAGDEDARNNLASHFYPSSLRLAQHFDNCFTGDVTAEDMVQESFAKAFEHLHEFNREAKFSTWLTRIIVNNCLQRGRKVKNRREVPENTLETDEGEKLGSQWADEAPDQERATVARQLKQEIFKKLKPEERLVLELQAVEGMSVEEMAAVIGKSEGAIKSRLLRARLHGQELYRKLTTPRRSMGREETTADRDNSHSHAGNAHQLVPAT